ncbi:MAG: hypothetical protein OXN89_13700 [Bryobacterales bacterium]|nr:hypothetical protein [Bryobacterales bacterium]
MFCRDTSVADAHLLAEDRQPPASLLDETLVSGRLLECEVGTTLHRRGLAGLYRELPWLMIGRVEVLEFTRTVVARALGAFPSLSP